MELAQQIYPSFIIRRNGSARFEASVYHLRLIYPVDVEFDFRLQSCMIH